MFDVGTLFLLTQLYVLRQDILRVPGLLILNEPEVHLIIRGDRAQLVVTDLMMLLMLEVLFLLSLQVLILEALA